MLSSQGEALERNETKKENSSCDSRVNSQEASHNFWGFCNNSSVGRSTPQSQGSGCRFLFRPPAFLLRVRAPPALIVDVNSPTGQITASASAATAAVLSSSSSDPLITIQASARDNEDDGVVSVGYDCFLEDEVPEQLPEPPQTQGDEESSSALGLFPDLEALRYWSHPRGGLRQDTPHGNGENINMASSQDSSVDHDDFWDRSHQGVLWKRRDVFKNRWRPRWFVLNPRQGLLTYYLFSSDGAAATAVAATEAVEPSERSEDPSTNMRDRTLSYDTHNTSGVLSDLSLQVESNPSVVPRGTIYLPGCRVERNDGLSRVEEQLFAWTITAPSGAVSSTANTGSASLVVHLAARTAQGRDMWMQQLIRVCQRTGASVLERNDASINMMEDDDEGEADDEEFDGEGEAAEAPPVPRRQQSSESLDSQPQPAPAQSETRRIRRVGSSDSGVSEIGRESGHTFATTSSESASPTIAVAAEWDPSASQSANDVYYKNVPTDLRDQIGQTIDAYMPQLLRSPSNDTGWKAIAKQSQQDVPTQAFSKAVESNKNVSLVHTSAEFPAPHSPMELFRMLADHQQRPKYEASCASSQRLRHFNPHTVLDAYHYSSPLWPRMVACFMHWRCLKAKEAGGKDAILMVGGSCVQAVDALEHCETNDKAGKKEEALLLVSATLLCPSAAGGTHWSRLVALDPKVPGWAHNMAQAFFVNGQAKLPKLLAQHLVKENGNDRETPSDGMFSEKQLAQYVPDADGTTRLSQPPPQQNGHEMNGSSSPDGAASTTTSTPVAGLVQRPPVLWQAAFLLAPTLFYHISKQQQPRFFPLLPEESPLSLFVFVVAVWWCLRQWVLAHYQVAEAALQGGAPLLESMTCHFSVQVKGSLRYISNQKEEQELRSFSPRSLSFDYSENDDGKEAKGDAGDASHSKSVSVVHIVASALARVWSKHVQDQEAATSRVVRQRLHRLCVPWLGIDEVVVDPSKDVSVAIVSPNEGETCSGITMVPKANQLTVQEIANLGAPQAAPPFIARQKTVAADCAVVLATSPSSASASAPASPSSLSGGRIGGDASWQWSALPHGSTQIVVVIGGLSLDSSSTKSPRHKSGSAPQAVLSLSVTVRGEDAAAAVRIVPEIQTLLQFPEMCDP